jgi:hypothetical protein
MIVPPKNYVWRMYMWCATGINIMRGTPQVYAPQIWGPDTPGPGARWGPLNPWRILCEVRHGKDDICGAPVFGAPRILIRGALKLSAPQIMGLWIRVFLVVKRIFPTRVTQGLISNFRGTVEKAPLILMKQPGKQALCLVSPTPPSGCQAQGFDIRK